MRTTDGYYVAGFVTDDPSHLFVLKLDQDQEVLWKYQYGFDCGDGIGAQDWRNDPNPSMFQMNTNLFSTTLTATGDKWIFNINKDIQDTILHVYNANP